MDQEGDSEEEDGDSVVGDQWKPDEKVFKYRQSIHHKDFLSEYVFPSISHYPKSFNTRDMRMDPNMLQ